MPSDTRPVESHVLYIGESAKTFCADFQDYPEVANGETLSSPSISITNPSGSTSVTVASATVLTSAFTDYDRNGKVDETVPSGKGVAFTATPAAGSKGLQVTATVLVLASGGATLGKQVNFVCK